MSTHESPEPEEHQDPKPAPDQHFSEQEVHQPGAEPPHEPEAFQAPPPQIVLPDEDGSAIGEGPMAEEPALDAAHDATSDTAQDPAQQEEGSETKKGRKPSRDPIVKPAEPGISRFKASCHLREHPQTQAVSNFLREAQPAFDQGTWIPDALMMHPLLRNKRNHPDLPVILVLSDILYRFRPVDTFVSSKGKSRAEKTRGDRPRYFEGDMVCYTYRFCVARFGLTRDQAQRAIAELIKRNIITAELRNIVREGLFLSNVLYVRPNLEVLQIILRLSSTATPVEVEEAKLYPALSEDPDGLPELPQPFPAGVPQQVPQTDQPRNGAAAIADGAYTAFLSAGGFSAADLTPKKYEWARLFHAWVTKVCPKTQITSENWDKYVALATEMGAFKGFE